MLSNSLKALIVLVNLFLLHSLNSIRVVNLITDSTIPYVKYEIGLKWQTNLLKSYINQQSENYNLKTVGTLLLLQHSSTYSLGSSSDESTSGPFNLLPKDSYEVLKVERGGQTTYHGPGQLVVYPIFDLSYFKKDINFYLRSLEEIIIEALSKYDINGYIIPGLTGVWVENVKIAAIGIKLSRWITMHGLSINVNPDMIFFDNIVPCGIIDRKPGSLKSFRPDISIDVLANDIIESFCKVFQLEIAEYLHGISAEDFLNRQELE